MFKFFEKKTPFTPLGELTTVIDIGSQKICCLIGRMQEARKYQILGVGYYSSEGVNLGFISHIEKVQKSIVSALQSAEKMANETIYNVITNISAYKSISHHVLIDLDMNNQMISYDDIEVISRELHQQLSSSGTALIHTQPIMYNLDGNHAISNPVGMIGENLEIEFHSVGASHSMIQNIRTCLKECHIDIDYMIHPAIASGIACLDEDEMQLGVTLIDIGAETTSIALFNNGFPIYTTCIPLGGRHITNDIARGLNISLFDAERIKTLQGHVFSYFEESDEEGVIDLQLARNIHYGAAQQQTISKSLLRRIISARVDEMLEMISNQLQRTEYFAYTRSRIVLTGGGSQLSGLVDYVQKFFGTQTRQGFPKLLKGLGTHAQDPSFSTAVGMLLYRQFYANDMSIVYQKSKVIPGFFSRISSFLKENF